MTDQIQAIDVTEEMSAQINSQAFKDKLLSGNWGNQNHEYYDDDEYEEYDEEEYDHMEREDL